MMFEWICSGCEQFDVPQDGHAWRRGYLHPEESSVELHPLPLRDPVSRRSTWSTKPELSPVSSRFLSCPPATTTTTTAAWTCCWSAPWRCLLKPWPAIPSRPPPASTTPSGGTSDTRKRYERPDMHRPSQITWHFNSSVVPCLRNLSHWHLKMSTEETFHPVTWRLSFWWSRFTLTSSWWKPGYRLPFSTPCEPLRTTWDDRPLCRCWASCDGQGFVITHYSDCFRVHIV